jgi:hypothetical protein
MQSVGRRRFSQKIACISVLIAGAVLLHSASTSDWPRWRGPSADGVADGQSLPLKWSLTENIRWSVKLPGWGTSSPVVWRGRLFVTTQTEEGGKKSLLTLCFRTVPSFLRREIEPWRSGARLLGESRDRLRDPAGLSRPDGRGSAPKSEVSWPYHGPYMPVFIQVPENPNWAGRCARCR